MLDTNLIYIIVAALAGLVSKIVWDWLKNRNEQGKGTRCDPRHEKIDDWQRDTDMVLVQHKAKIEEHERRLDKGSDDFELIKSGIAGLNTSFSVLAEKVK
jgi:hypothetical protein